MGSSSFSVGDGGGKCGVGTRTTHLTSQNVDCCIDGGDFVSSRSRNYSSTRHPYNNMSYYLSNIRREDYYVAVGDVGGGDGTITT